MYAATSQSSTTTFVKMDSSVGGSSSASATTRVKDANNSERRPCQDSKDALCRRMGALFLRHRVEQLGDDVEKTGGKLTTRRSCPVQRRIRQCHGRGSDQDIGDHHHHHTASASASAATYANCASEESAGGKAHTESVDYVRSNVASKIIVADASLLIYSLRTVHDWLKAGDCRVVIPCEALSTLDVLKKGEHVLNMAARRATRFLDERFSPVESFEVDGSDQARRKLSPGLYPQSMQQREDLHAETTKAKLIALGASPDAVDAAPLHVQKTLSCFVHFALRAATDDAHDTNAAAVTCSIAIALPPPHLDYDEVSAQDKATLRYAERADGKVVMQCVKMLGLTGSSTDDRTAKLIIAPTAASWLTAQSPSDIRSMSAHHHHHHHHHHHQHSFNDHIHHAAIHQQSLSPHRPHSHRHAVRHANARQC